MEPPKGLQAAFELVGVRLPLDRILPTKQIEADARRNGTLRRIIASIREVGIIEPLVVHRIGHGKTCTYSLLDGHIRLEAVRQLHHLDAPCLISTDDETYTYNHKVNIVPPIQEHFMIMRALSSGVSEERIARALDVDVARIKQKRDLLNGICSEAVDLLKHKHPSADALKEVRKVKPMRQIEMAELMLATNNFTAGYAKCLLAATAESQLVDGDQKRMPRGIKPEEMSRIEREVVSLEQDFKVVESDHGKNVLNLVLVTAYLRRLLANANFVRFMTARHSDILTEFQRLAESGGLERGN